MDEALFTRYSLQKPPFDGDLIAPVDLISLENLGECVRLIYTHLPWTGEVRILPDWHEHDGYITASRKIDQASLHAMIADDRSIYESRQRDAFVRWGFYTQEFGFYFRYNVLGEDEDEQYPGIWGSFDLSMDSKSINLMGDLLNLTNVQIRKFRSFEFFRQSYAG